MTFLFPPVVTTTTTVETSGCYGASHRGLSWGLDGRGTVVVTSGPYRVGCVGHGQRPYIGVMGGFGGGGCPSHRVMSRVLGWVGSPNDVISHGVWAGGVGVVPVTLRTITWGSFTSRREVLWGFGGG